MDWTSPGDSDYDERRALFNGMIVEDGLVVDLRPMKQIEIDASRRTS